VYGGNNLINFTDPTGLLGLDLFGIIKPGDASSSGGIDINLGLASVSAGSKGVSVEAGIPILAQAHAGANWGGGLKINTGTTVAGISIGVDVSVPSREVSAGINSDFFGIPLVGLSVGTYKHVDGSWAEFIDGHVPGASLYADTEGNIQAVVGPWAMNHGAFSDHEGWSGDWFWNRMYGKYAGLLNTGHGRDEVAIDEVDDIAKHHDRDAGLFPDKSIAAGAKARELLRSRYFGLKPYQRVGLRNL